ncbi:MAG: hypothetical protein K0S18_1179, partial [Anaerocolumna sp.]|nr:hypothetical protein [Anaerocolumna sp.]
MNHARTVLEQFAATHIRGCTGFDGGFEVVAAIRGLGPRHQLRIKFKRRRKFSVRCLVAAVEL